MRNYSKNKVKYGKRSARAPRKNLIVNLYTMKHISKLK